MSSSNENKYKTVKQSFLGSSQFNIIKVSDQQLIATLRRSMLPKRGLFRLFIPQTRVIVINKNQNFAISIRPDFIATFMAIMILGALAVEFFMSRSLYPRDYPPEFIYGLAIFYIGMFIVDIFHTRKKIRALLRQINTEKLE